MRTYPCSLVDDRYLTAWCDAMRSCDREDVSYLQYASCSVLERWWSDASVVPAARSALFLQEKVS